MRGRRRKWKRALGNLSNTVSEASVLVNRAVGGSLERSSNCAYVRKIVRNGIAIVAGGLGAEALEVVRSKESRRA